MSELVVTQLENRGLLNGADIGESSAMRLSLAELADLGKEAIELSDASSLPLDGSPFAPVASLSLGGGRAVCWNGHCRLQRAFELAQYAALYADKVYLYNFLADHAESTHQFGSASIEERRFALLDDLRIIALLRPLIETGKVVLIAPTEYYCPHCLATLSFGADADKRWDRVYRGLTTRFLREVSATAELRSGHLGILLEGPSELMDHGSRVFVPHKVPDALKARAHLMAQLKRGESIPLSVALRRAMGLHSHLAEEAFADVRFELTIAQCIGAPFLTERPLHLEILSNLSSDPEQANRNATILQHLRSLLPFVGDVPVSDLLELREREQPAFLAYRQSLTSAVETVISAKGSLSAKDAKQLYADVIAPSLARLDQAVAKAKKDLIRRSAISIASWGAVLAFGTYTGLMPEGILAAAKAFGFVKASTDLLQNLAESRSAAGTIRAQDMYYLWRVRQLTAGRVYEQSNAVDSPTS